MSWMLDTNICIAAIKEREGPLTRRIEAHPANALLLSVITVAELLAGVEKSVRQEQNLSALEKFSSPMRTLPFNLHAAHHYAGIRADLERAGNIMGPMDLLIAAHALAEGAVLVTNKEREFRRVPGLVVENWVVT